MSDYWRITIEEILGEAKVEATEEQINQIAENVASAASVSTDYSAPVSGTDTEKELRSELEKHKNKTVCPKCNGKGGHTVPVGTSHTTWNKCDCDNGFIY